MTRRHRQPAAASAPVCPCGSTRPYAECCAPLHDGRTDAPTAEALMRSRFSAFALGDTAYLLRTWHPRTRPDQLTLDPRQRWFRLDVVDTERGGLLDNTGTVEFHAHYRYDGRADTLRERSRFSREDSRWVYLDGTTPPA